jgi:hypothetical protein
MYKDGRETDLKKLRAEKPKDALHAKKINDAGTAIQKERMDGYIGGAREALMKASQKRDWEEAKDISDSLIKHKEQGIGRSSYFISLPKGLK